MKTVAIEREKIRQRERERLARGDKVSLRRSPKQYMQRAVDRFNLQQMGRPGGGARTPGPGRLPRPGTLHGFRTKAPIKKKPAGW